MRKQLLILLAIAFINPLNGFAQENLEYSGVIEVDNVSADELYERSKVWFASRYRSANDVIQYDSKEQAQIIGKANMSYEQSFISGRDGTRGFIRYEVNIMSRDGRFRYEFKNFIHEATGHGGAYSVGVITTSDEHPNTKGMIRRHNNRVLNDMKSQIDEQIETLIENLIFFMQKDSATDDDW